MFYRFYRRTTVEIIKYESDLLKRWFAAVKANELNNEGEIDLVLEIMYHFDSKSNKRLLKKFEKLDYAKTFFEQEPLRDVVLKGKFLRGTLGAALKDFWSQPNYSKDLVKDGLKAAKKRDKKYNVTEKEKKFWSGIFMEHDLIHFFFHLDTTTIGELSNLGFTCAKSFRKSFFLIMLVSAISTLFEYIKNPIGLLILRWNVRKVHSIKFNLLSVWKIMWKAYWVGKKRPWLLSIDWHIRLNEPLHLVEEELGIMSGVDFGYYHKLEKEIKKINWWLEYGKRTAFQQQILINRLIKNNGVPFKILP